MYTSDLIGNEFDDSNLKDPMSKLFLCCQALSVSLNELKSSITKYETYRKTKNLTNEYLHDRRD